MTSTRIRLRIGTRKAHVFSRLAIRATAVANSADEAQPLGVAKHIAMTEPALAVSSDGESSDGESSDGAGHSCSKASLREIEGASSPRPAGSRLELTKMGAELTDDEVSELVRVVQEAGGGMMTLGSCE